ncbi:DNA replication factor Cdt1-like [Oopsacas minuta]|uniref:DNA replication factor Cdt1-like n=1 Tax=Oopsacas minuta TaxID=111878 RepID=A0AAV7K005_9METZ|nr:DNA replication factor Cdt1-like [Oopsacas minuta]
MSNSQTLLEGFFHANGRKRQNTGSIPISKRSKELTPAKSILSLDYISLQKEQIKQQPVPQPIIRKAKLAPARKPRACKKLMQATAPPPTTRSSKRNAKLAPKETFLKLGKALSHNKSPLKSSTPLNSGFKALSATKQDTQQLVEPKITSPISSPTILKIPTPGGSTMEQIKRVRNKLLQQSSKNYNIPPLPNQTDKPSLAQRLAEPTIVELSRNSNETLKPIETPSEASCMSPSKKDCIIRKLALLKTPEKSPKMKEFKELQFTSPTKKSINTTPLKSPQYKNSYHLAADSQTPISYTQSILLEHFRCIDVVLSMVERRKESCSFEKLQRAVTTMCGKQMTLRNLAQIMHLYPTAFSLSYQPIRTSIHSPRRGQFQLIIVANNDFHSESPTDSSEGKTLTNQGMLARKNQFLTYIIEYLKGYHNRFLRALVPPIILPNDKIKRWHPEFNLETVPSIPEGNMPQKPQTNTPQTAKQILASSQELLPTRISRVMLKFTEENSTQDSTIDSNSKVSYNDSNELKGISKNLIERIRIREQEKAKLNMIRDDTVLHKLDMLERIPEICSIVRNMYLAEQRGTLPWADVLYKLRDSHHSKMEQKYLEEHLQLLLEILPQWISVVNPKGTKFLKVKRNTPLNTLLSDLEREKARLDTEQ